MSKTPDSTGKAATRPESSRPDSGLASEVRFSIRVASQLTSVPLDTLRMWERRYGFPRPARTNAGSRVYTQSDVATLILIQRALALGYRPREVVGKSPAELELLVNVASSGSMTGQGAPSGEAADAPTQASILAAVARDDLATLRAELRQAASLLGPMRFLVEVAHPLAVQVGVLWAEGKLEVRHEHLLSECLSEQLRVLLSTYEDRPGSRRVLLTTLPGERHELGLVMAAVYLAARDVTPVLLGLETPAPQIVRAAQGHQVAAVALLVTAASDLKATTKAVHALLAELPRRIPIWIGGAAGDGVGIDDRSVRLVGTWDAFDTAIANLDELKSAYEF